MQSLSSRADWNNVRAVRVIKGKPAGRMELFGKSDIEGKAAMGSGERAGTRTSFKWAGAHESISKQAIEMSGHRPSNRKASVESVRS